MPQIELSIVDIGPFIDGDAGARRKVARCFGEAFETTGFAVITGHGLPEAQADLTYRAVKEFFSLSLDEKRAYTPVEATKGRGYLPMGIESVAKTLSGETPYDLCEALVFSGSHRTGAASRPDIWPDRPPGLRPIIEQWRDATMVLTGHLLKLSALALDLEEAYFQDAFGDPSLVLRFVHYPDQPEVPRPGQLRYGAHHDYGALTILRQDSAPGGLQICDRDGEWKEAGVVPGSLVINVGDLMARWTNDRWRSTLHRVSNPDRSLTGSTARLSMVAFTGPAENVEVSCLPTCCGPGNPPRYEPVKAGDYVRGKLATSMEGVSRG